MENTKPGYSIAILAAIGTSILSPIFVGVSDRFFQRNEDLPIAVAELTVELRGLKEQVTKLTNEPYVTREELREMRTEFTRFNERLDRLERK